jgi:hypothetical protein
VETFYVIGLGKKASCFLGHAWLKKHNPQIDWARNRVQFSGCPPECNMKKGMTWITNKSKEVINKDDSILIIDFEPAMEVRGIEIQAKFT